MRTLDGQRGSANKILEALQKEKEEEYKRVHNKQFVSDFVCYKIKQTNEHNIFRKVFVKYNLLRIRAKISFMAFEKRMTITELFSTTIMKCWYELQNEGFYPGQSKEEIKRDESLINQIFHKETNGFIKFIVDYNLQNWYRNK